MPSLRDGLAAEYLFNGNAHDTSGHGKHARAIGAALCPDRFGNPDSAYAFDGKDDYLIAVDPPAMSAETLSVSVWVRFSDGEFHGWNSAIVAQDDNDEFWRSYERHSRVLQLALRDRQITWHRMGWGGDDAVAQRPFQVGVWHHIAAVVDGKAHHLYIDGALHDTKESWFTSHPEEPLYIGRKAPPDRNMFFKGAIDDIRIYNRALSAKEVAALCHEHGWQPPATAAPYSPAPEPLTWLGADWTSLDIETLVPGSSVPEGDRLTITAGGLGIRGMRDSFRYVYQSITGDFEARVSLTDIPRTHAWVHWARAGIMLRHGLDANSPHVGVFGHANGGGVRDMGRLYRSEAGGKTDELRGQAWERHEQPLHLKLRREAGRVVASYSFDGETWQPLGEPSEFAPDGQVYVGIAVTPRSFGNVGEFGFADWRLTTAD